MTRRLSTRRGRTWVWTPHEVDLLERHFPVVGLAGCRDMLADRTDGAIVAKAQKMELRDPTLPPPRALNMAIGRGDQLRALQLRREGWTFDSIGAEFGVCASAANNAVLVAECRAAGFTPARRDRTGSIYPAEIEQMRAMMRQGLEGVEIQRRMGVSGAAVSNQRRRLAAEVARTGEVLPQPGLGRAYPGRRVPVPVQREIERLLNAGLSIRHVVDRVDAGRKPVEAIRARLVQQLARSGRCLPGCDLAGRRRTLAPRRAAVPASVVAAVRERLLDGSPVRSAANELGLGRSSAYAIRDALAAELAAEGRALPKPDRSGARRSPRWLPVGPRWIYRYRTLSAEHGAIEAKAMILAELAAANRAEALRPKTFDEQLARAGAGARLVDVRPIRKADPTGTLGGIATGML